MLNVLWVALATMATALGQNAQSVLYGLGSSSLPEGPQVLYSIDPESGTAVAIGDIGTSNCRGLTFDLRGRLLTACRRPGETAVFWLINPMTGSGQLAPGFEPFPRGAFGEFGVLDLAFRPQDRVLISLENLVSCILCDPPPLLFSRVNLRDSADGSSLHTSPAGFVSEVAPIISVVAFRDGVVYGIRSEVGFGAQLLALDWITGELGPPLDLGLDGHVLDLDFEPQSGRGFVVLPRDPAGTLLAVLGDDGQAEIIAEMPEQILSIAFSRPAQTLPETEWILPNLHLSPSSQRHLAAALSILNQGDTVARGSIQIFDNAGVRQDPNLICAFDGLTSPPSPDRPEGAVMVGPGQALIARMEDFSGTVSGWVRLRRVGVQELDVKLELVYREPEQFCLPFYQTASQDFLTGAAIQGVRPSLTFSALAAISDDRESAFAIVNPSPTEAAQVSIQASHLDGRPFDANEFEVGPRQRVDLLLFEMLNRGKDFILPPQRPRGFLGSVRISSDIPVAVAGLDVQLPEGKWVNLPASSARPR